MANENPSTPKSGQEVVIIPLSKIHNLPGGPSASKTEKPPSGLVSSILLKGVQEPVIVRKREDGEYQLIDGYRRRNASEAAKKTDIPAVIADMTEKEAVKARWEAHGVTVLASLSDMEKQPDAGKEPAASNAVPIPAAEKKPDVSKTSEASKAASTEKKAEAKTAAAPAEAKKKEPDAKTPPDPEGKKAQPDKPKEAGQQKKDEKAAAPIGTYAVGPTGTAITKILEKRLAPPDEKDRKTLELPKEGEAFSVLLHPAYLKKADFNQFSVDRESDDWKELYKSIELNGVKDPVLARPGKNGILEILSGQRRHLIAAELNYPVPTIIQRMDDDDARILVADGNLHREKISTYDQCRALKMKMESMKHKAGRRKKGDSGRHNTDELLAKEMGISIPKLNRMIRLSEATREVCGRMDDGSLTLSVASAISFLTPANQNKILDLIDVNYKVNTDRIERMKKAEKAGKLTDAAMRDIMEDRDIAPKAPPAPPVTPAPTPTTYEPAPAPAPATPSMAPGKIPASPDVPAPAKVAAPSAPAQAAGDPFTGKQERPEETKIILRGDRLRKYFPDVSMTPREIEESIYSALEERRQRQARQAQKEAIFKKDGKSTPAK